MKDLEDWAAVQKVYKQTKSKRATAEILGISRNTVKKLLGLTKPPKYQRTAYGSKIDKYKEQIIEWRCEPYCFNGTRIYRELRTQGDGSIVHFAGWKRLSKLSEKVLSGSSGFQLLSVSNQLRQFHILQTH